MSAKEMFEGLAKGFGYELQVLYDDSITYFIPIGGESWKIEFQENQEISIHANNISKEELILLNKAIQKQIEELGW